MVHIPQHDSCHMTLTAGAALGSYIRVKLHTDGTVLAAGVTENAIGYMTERGAASGASATVRLIGMPFNAIAAGAIEVGDKLFAAADGKVNDVDAGNGLVVGIALTAAAADTDPLTVLQTDYVS